MKKGGRVAFISLFSVYWRSLH